MPDGELKYSAIDWAKVRDRDVAMVALDRPCEHFDWLLGHAVLIDGAVYRVTGVEAHATMQHSPGEVIGLYVKVPDA